MRGKAVVAAAFVGAALVASRAAFAAPARVDLTWRAPADCPTGDAIALEVDRILGDSGARPTTPLVVRAEVTAADDAFSVRLEMLVDGASRSRALQGKTCAAVGDAAALVIALVIDPNAIPEPKPAPAVAGVLPPAPVAPIEAPKPPPPAPVAKPIVVAPAAPKPLPYKPRAKEPRAVSLHISAAVDADAGSLPGVGAGFVALAALHVAWARVEVGPEIFPTRTSTLADGASGGTVALWAVTAAACGAFSLPRFELGPCLGGEFGRISAKGFGVTNPGGGASPWSAFHVGARAAWFPFVDGAASHVGLSLHVDALAPTTRPTFVLENVAGSGTVFRSSALAGRLAAGLEARF